MRGLTSLDIPHPTGFRFGCCSRELFSMNSWDYVACVSVVRWAIPVKGNFARQAMEWMEQLGDPLYPPEHDEHDEPPDDY